MAILLKTASVQLSSIQIMQVRVQNKGKSVSKSRYDGDGDVSGIYPQWTTIVKTIPNPVGENRKRFAQEQESARKNVKRAFGVLQSRWGIIRYPANTWSTRKLWKVMTACVIMHNMIVEDERPVRLYDKGFQFQGQNVVPEHGVAATFEQFTQFHEDMRD